MGPATDLRIVFDTNIVISVLLFGRRLTWLKLLWANGDLTPLVCQETARELFIVLNYPKFGLNAAQQQDAMAEYLPFTEMSVLPSPLPCLPVSCRDPNDEKFLHLALTAKADFLVTGDADLLVLRGLVGVSIITLAELRDLLP